MESEIDRFIRYLATERGLSDNYQLSTQQSLCQFADWAREERRLETAAATRTEDLTDYLAARRRLDLAPGTLRLNIIALKLFFRFLHQRGRIPADPAGCFAIAA